MQVSLVSENLDNVIESIVDSGNVLLRCLDAAGMDRYKLLKFISSEDILYINRQQRETVFSEFNNLSAYSVTKEEAMFFEKIDNLKDKADVHDILRIGDSN